MTKALHISILNEIKSEPRLSITPEIIKKYTDLGIQVTLDVDYGTHLFSENDWVQAGAKVASSTSELYENNVFLQVNCPDESQLKWFQPETTLVALLQPFKKVQQLKELVQMNIRAMGMEFMPRSTYAQKMDALSSQSSLAGYVAVNLAADRLNQILPMMTTPAGTIAPSRVFVIGAGVAGLQAIATARRLGARVEAFDTRPVVEEQVKSLGAKFIKCDLGNVGESNQGYATQLTDTQLKMQHALMEKACMQADIVITTAQLFGKKAPLIITDAMIQKMKKGSVVVDLAVETGGNVEGIQMNKECIKHGVLLVGLTNLAGKVAKHASQVYANNLFHFIKEFYNSQTGQWEVDHDHDIIKSVLTVDKGAIVQPMLKWEKWS